MSEIIFIKGKNEKSYLKISDEPFIMAHEGMTDNQCEWCSLIDAMNIVSGEAINKCDIYTDSLLLYRQICGVYRIKSKNLKPLYFQYNILRNILSGQVSVKYVSGSENEARDLID